MLQCAQHHTFCEKHIITFYKGSHQKKKVKKFHNKGEIRGGGPQILVCEPQKSAFFRANFPKKTC